MAVADVVISIGVIASFYGLLALGMNIKYGHTGLLDFGHVGFYLVGAYTAALFAIGPDVPNDFTQYLFGLNMPWLVAAAAGTLLAGIVGAFVALPTIRLREDYLAITVLGVSVILQRIVQAESWLVNGPDALRGYNQPLKGTFPLSGQTSLGFTLDGLVVFLILVLILGGLWGVLTYALGRIVELGGDRDGDSKTLVARLHLVVSLGYDRLLEGRRKGSGNPEHENESGGLSAVAGLGAGRHVGSAVFAGLSVGVVGAILILTTSFGLLAWGIVVSVLSWVVVLVALYRYLFDFRPVDYGATLALGAAYMLAFAPVFFLDSDVEGIPLTLIAFGLVIGTTYYLQHNWSRFAARPFEYGVVSMLWFGVIWYLPLQILTPLQNGSIGTVGTILFESVVWVLSFSQAEPTIGYSRFLLFLFGTIVLASLYVSELTVRSPFGRVLRAVRNDEQVVSSLGKDPFLYKVQSMAIGSAFAGLAGALAAIYFQALVFTNFAPRVTFIALLMMFLGGVGNNRAMVIGAMLFWSFQTATAQLSGFVAPELRTRVQAFRFVIMGTLFLLLLYYRPEGLLGERSAAGVDNE